MIQKKFYYLKILQKQHFQPRILWISFLLINFFNVILLVLLFPLLTLCVKQVNLLSYNIYNYIIFFFLTIIVEDSSAYNDPKKLLIKKRETRELAKLTHSMSLSLSLFLSYSYSRNKKLIYFTVKPGELMKLFDLEGGERKEGDIENSMSRETFKEMMQNTGLVLAKDPALLDALFDIFDIFLLIQTNFFIIIYLIDRILHLDMSGTVERKELLVGLITLNSGTLSQKLKRKYY